MNYPLITQVEVGSPAQRAGLLSGCRLLSINGHPIGDVLDYRFYSYERRLTLQVEDQNGVRSVPLVHPEGGDLGLCFQSYLMDKPRHCRNKCVFCFIDQQPCGLREALYFKDDDARLSFLMGNYITLTNLTEDDLRRIMAQHISPIRISIHAADPEVRRILLGNPKAGDCLETLKRLADANIHIHGQIVLCPGLNDGEVLTQTLTALDALGDALKSVSVVPVGLTKYREGLYPLTSVTKDLAKDCIARSEKFPRVYCGDELYSKAGLPIPQEAYYDDYPQLENGVGMVRSFLDDFERCKEETIPSFEGTLATGAAFAPFLQELLTPYQLQSRVKVIQNSFWGAEITVAGLVVGADLVTQLQGQALGKRLILPATMLRHGGDLFLDGMSPEEVSQALAVSVEVVAPDGGALADLLFNG